MSTTEPVDTDAMRARFGPLDISYGAMQDVFALCDEVDRLTAALDRVRTLHRPVEWSETDEDGTPDLAKPLAPFCRECTDEEYVAAVEFGDTIDLEADVVAHPCATIRALDALDGACCKVAPWKGSR